jgi:hypothetical protein
VNSTTVFFFRKREMISVFDASNPQTFLKNFHLSRGVGNTFLVLRTQCKGTGVFFIAFDFS